MSKCCKWLFALVGVQPFVIVLALMLSLAAANPGTAYALVSLPQPGSVLDEQTIRQQASEAFHGADLTGKDGPLQKIGYDLAFLYTEFQAFRATPRLGGATFHTT